MSFNEFQKACLDAHNESRKKHGAGPLELDEKLCRYAFEWATKLQKEEKAYNRPDSLYGENVFVCIGMPVDGALPVEVWYKEIEFYDFEKAEFVDAAGHFTQLVWKNTKRLGVVKLTDKREKSKSYVVANYDPPGNIISLFAKNVQPIQRKTEAKSIKSKSIKAPGFNEFQLACLHAHNEFRAMHGVAPLVLDEKLCKYAAEWASKLLQEKTIIPRTNVPYGENVYMSGGVPVDGAFPVKAWYSEIQLYDYKKPKFSDETGHFTQLVWKDSKKLGIAKVLDKQENNMTIVVANYDPPGNVSTLFKKNVLPLKVKEVKIKDKKEKT